MLADLGLILLLILLNGLFVAAEIAFVTVRRTRLDELADEGDRRAARALRLLKDPGRFLAVIQVAITFLGALASAVAAVSIVELLATPLSGVSWIGERAGVIALLVVTLLVSVVSIVLGELIPKGFALANPDRIALVASGPISLFAKIVSPLVALLVLLTKVISKPFGIDPTRTPELSAAEIRLIVEQGSQQGVLEAEEEQMISAVMSLSDSKLHEVMVPRIDIVAIDQEATFDEAVEVVLKEGHSRTPLYRESVDHIVGILYAKDLLRLIAAGGTRPRLRDIMRPALFVPESQSVDDLLHELQRRKVHMAVVLDEYGGTAGLVTIEDLLEEIVGEIQDEFDEEEPMKVEIGPGEVILDGRAAIDDLTELVEPALELEDDEEYDTLGGFVYHRIGRVPVVGDAVVIEPFVITVIKVSGRRVGKVRVRWTPISTAAASNGDEGK
ncbi:MAG: HlyC/CorC family transporter [Candidatus Limnocylindrus sp. ZSMar2m-chloro-G89]|nr:MAG: HlyC/CorC family transporter [Candidatus Limnocylindrus sp.]RLT49627.1 MAG: HlyC/CorC family transporter [Candidatus Limnocylindrus sp. ZSMar2m-chloro-G89]